MKNDEFSFRKRIRSFRYAFRGIGCLIRGEANARIHCFATVCVVAAGWLLELNRTEWMLVVFAIGSVWAGEAFNSSIEALCDRVSPEYDEAIKRSKDLAAGAVLLTAIAAAIIGSLVFIPKIYALFV